MQKILHCFLFFVSTMLLMSPACDNKNGKNNDAIKKISGQYENGEISECTLNGARVYMAQLNAFDAGAEIYDGSGKKIGNCYYATGVVDAICRQLQTCEVIYRCNNHITGQPAIDKYGLFKKK